MAYFGTPTQTPFTDFPLGDNELFIGIPFVLGFYVSGTSLKQIGMYEFIENQNQPRVWYVNDPTFPTLTIIAKTVMIYNNYYTFTTDEKIYYFSTLNDGNILPLPSNPTVNPSASQKYKIYRYFTDLKYGNINLNNYTDVELGWSSSDIDGGQTISSYGNDTVIVSMYTSAGVLKLTSSMVTNGTTLPIQTFSTLPSGTYYFNYDFTSFRLEEINSYTPPPSVPPFPNPPYEVYTYGNTNSANTSTFTFITQFVQSVSANDIFGDDTTSTITVNVGIGHTGYSYLLSINDVNGFSLRTTFPYTYTLPASSTKLYTVTVSNSDDTNDQGVYTTTFTAYRYVTSITIANLIIESPQNFVSWVGGAVTDFFQYGTTPITTNGSTAFTVGDPMDTNLIETGIAYRIQPSNINENINVYPPFYFDSITPNTLRIVSNNTLQTYDLSWTSYFTSSFTAPDGTREYPITITSSTTTYTGTTTYNKFSLPFNEVESGVAYTVEVSGIELGTGIFFFDTPTNFAITPNKINFNNTVTWVAIGNPFYYVSMGRYVFLSQSPFNHNLTEDIIDPVGTVSFRPSTAPSSANIITDSYNLSANTILIILPSPLFFFSGVYFSVDDGDYLFPSDTYSLSLYRNGAVVQQLEASIITPFTFIPYDYVADYQPGDQLYLKSNQHLNYGISSPFTFVVNASVTVNQTEYSSFSSIVATMMVDADVDFTVQLRGPVTIPVAFTLQGNEYTIQLNQYNIPLGNYQLDFLLVNSPSIIVTTPTFLVTSSVTVDQPEYTIISTVNATLYIGVPTTFTVQLQDVDQLFPAITLPSFMANPVFTYSFRLYGLGVTDGNYELRFIDVSTGTVLISPVFAVSTTYFSLEKPVVPIPPSRATTNTLCVTSKKNNVPTAIISIRDNIVYPTAIRGQPQFLVPCGILSHLKELTELLKTLTLRNALIFLIQKYDIPQSTPAVTNQKRYQLPTANSKVLNPILQYTSSFRLSSKVPGNSVPIDTFFAEKLSDARVLTLCNDDTKTFSTLYTDMLKNATYWLSTLAPFAKDGDYTFCVVRPIQGSLKQFITASISLKDNLLIFTPVIARVVLSFYEPYGAVDFSVMFTSPLLSEIVKYLLAQYEKIYINPATAL